MKNKVTVICGLPCTGKTYLMRTIMRQLGSSFRSFNFGVLHGTFYADSNVYVIGIYDSEIYSGTDRLSMAVQPVLERFLEKVGPGAKLIMEGDRITTASFLRNVREGGHELSLYILKISEKEMGRRRAERKDSKTDAWMKSRETKIQNIQDQFESSVVFSPTPEAADNLSQHIIKDLKSK